MLTLLLAATIAHADPSLQATADLDLGRQLLTDKNADGAALSLQRCIDRHPPATVEADCQWELGWAHWLQTDWPGVVTAWERVKILDPDREGLDDYLSQAHATIDMQTMLDKSRATAPKTFVSAAPAGATLHLRATGDCMIGTDFPSGQLSPGDGADIFADVTDWLSDADLTVGNLEGPLCDRGTTRKCRADAKPGSCYAFRQPARYAAYYKAAGFDVMSTANNHAGDFGATCRSRTEELLDQQGIGHSGRPGDIDSRTVNGLKIATIGFHSNRNSHYTLDLDTAAQLISSLAADHDIVIVIFHGGAEGSKAIHTPQGTETYYGENRGDLRAFTHAVVDAGADVVIGSGPHVLRGMEIYKGRLIAYSLGNFATYGPFNTRGYGGIGAILDVTVDRQGAFVSGRILPTKQVGEGVPMKDPEAQAIDLVRTLTAQDFPKYGVAVAQDGSIAAR
ncbi:MAG: CapA family protein [Oligoflexia bacterium]|nr:CapA family protein [Oligoflexia bacterium]